MAITHWTDDIPAQMEEMCHRGVTSFKVYLAYDDLRLTPEQIGKVLEAAGRPKAVLLRGRLAARYGRITEETPGDFVPRQTRNNT